MWVTQTVEGRDPWSPGIYRQCCHKSFQTHLYADATLNYLEVKNEKNAPHSETLEEPATTKSYSKIPPHTMHFDGHDSEQKMGALSAQMLAGAAVLITRRCGLQVEAL